MRNVFRNTTINELIMCVVMYDQPDNVNPLNEKGRQKYFLDNFELGKDLERNKWVAKRKVQ